MFFEPIILLVIPLLIPELNRLSYIHLIFVWESFYLFKKLYFIRLDVLHDNDLEDNPSAHPSWELRDLMVLI